jgi:hypothetical protein
MSVHNYSTNLKVTHMMKIGSANHVRKTRQTNVWLSSYVPIAELLADRMYRIPEYVPNAPMYLEHLPSDATLN